MKTYGIYIDYLSGEPKDIEYKLIEASGLGEAMMEADSLWNPETMYLIRIMSPVGKWEKADGNWRQKRYQAVACRRSLRWHPNDAEHCENEHFAVLSENKKTNDRYMVCCR